MKHLLFTLFIFSSSLLCTPSVFGQKCSDYLCVIAKVKKAITEKNYRFAFGQLESAKGYPNKNEGEMSELLKQIFNAVEKEKQEAIIARDEAKKQTIIANYEIVKTQKALEQTNLAQKQAEENLRQAKEAESRAMTQEGIAKKALAEAQDANIHVVNSYLRDIDQHILKLEYDIAFEKCQTALSLNVKIFNDTLKKRIIEIAFFYTERDTPEAAIKVLNILNINSLQNRKDLLITIQKNIPPEYFTFLHDRYYPKMIDIEGGWLEMYDGTKIKVNSFKMAETEVTFFQYNLFAQATKNYKKPPIWQYWGDNPATTIFWHETILYVNWLTKRNDLGIVYTFEKPKGNDVIIDYQAKGFRLPSEIEWEFAASGGNKTHGYSFSGSNDMNEVSWNYQNSNSRTHPVRGKKPNEIGLYDMTGNVWEWCENWYNKKYIKLAQTNVRYSKKGKEHSVRGGSWYGLNGDATISDRSTAYYDSSTDWIGFRIAQNK